VNIRLAECHSLEEARQETVQEREKLNALVWKLVKAVAAKDQERKLEHETVLELMGQDPDIWKDQRQGDREKMAKQVREHAAFAD
jgi:hypothetical protein